jgi:chromate transporter
LTTFGGATAHLSHFQKTLVSKHHYLTDEDLMELNSLCQFLPGPTSTQTLTAIGFRIGGPTLAYLTLLIWMLPTVTVMTIAAILMTDIQEKNWSLAFTRFIQPMAVAIVSYGAYRIALRTLKTKTSVAIMLMAAGVSYAFQTPFVFPVILLVSGFITAFKYKAQPKEEKSPVRIDWSNFALWGAVLVIAAVLGGLTKSSPISKPIRLFENFYRNGSLVFGGGQMLAPVLYTEFVQYSPKNDLKAHLSSQEFLSGYSVAQALPGPVFSFCAYIGALSMREYGLPGEMLGGLLASLGIFLPGTFLIFFVIRFWESLKKYRVVRASLEGVTAASAGLIASAAVIMFQPLENTLTNYGFTIVTFALLAFTRIPSHFLILAGLALGFIIPMS